LETKKSAKESFCVAVAKPTATRRDADADDGSEIRREATDLVGFLAFIFKLRKNKERADSFFHISRESESIGERERE
jgi:hypothetical protein